MTHRVLSFTSAALLAAIGLVACRPQAKDGPAHAGAAADSMGPAVAKDSTLQAQAKDSTTGADTSGWRISTRGNGALGPEGSEALLRQHYGAGVVTTTRVDLGEGETAPGTVLYPRDSSRMLQVLWQDTVARQRPTRVILRGSRSKWQVGPGISLGTSLKELEQLNGRPFTLAGFGWDYSGVVVDWNGGALDSVLTGIKVYLDADPAQYQSAAYMQVQGDRDYSSSLEPMRHLAPRVYQIFVDFAPAAESASSIISGVCPFECCQLGTWTARRPLHALQHPGQESPAASPIDSAESVIAERSEAVPGVLVQPLAADWWVRVRNSRGELGWLHTARVNMEGTELVASIDGTDGCSG